MNNITQLSVPILDVKNYNRWSVQMKVLFDYHDLLDVVESGLLALADNANDAQRAMHRDLKKKDKKVLYLIHQGMNDETFEQIEGATTACEAWGILLTSYKGDDKIKRVRLQTLRRQYELLQMEAAETIDAYINRVLVLTNNMKTNGEKLEEQSKMEKILRTLTPSLNMLLQRLKKGNDVSTMTVKLLSSSLRIHEQRMNDNRIDKSIEQAFMSQASLVKSMGTPFVVKEKTW